MDPWEETLLRKLGAWREGVQKWGVEKGSRENMREQDGQVGERTEKESKERDILIDGSIMGLARNLALGKFPGIHKDNLS